MDSLQTDGAVMAEIGRRLERLRLDRNESQRELAERAGISRATVVRAEQGQGINLKAFVRLTRALELLDGLDAFVPPPSVSPLAQLHGKGKPRQRASKAASVKAEGDRPNGHGFQWGTE